MPYSAGFKAEEYDEFRDLLRELGRQLGKFDANEATSVILNKRAAERGPGVPLLNAFDVIAVLRDMEDLGYVREAGRRGENGPVVWEYVEDEGDGRPP